jgi:hypothetical protein
MRGVTREIAVPRPCPAAAQAICQAEHVRKVLRVASMRVAGRSRPPVPDCDATTDVCNGPATRMPRQRVTRILRPCLSSV